ncbi:MAG: hypothetical protein J3Q66DRAFT_375100 [Benniella sp.]|nr:MAG: hypothetical protein J3Q66DRAFT_375100 [Benniella sp.]
MVLGNLGRAAEVDSSFYSLFETARTIKETARIIRETGTEEPLEFLSAPEHKRLPVVDTQKLYVRESYKSLYQEITSRFKDDPSLPRRNRIVVTGTSGIGNSAFLVYFMARCLWESDPETPPIVIFREKHSSDCYVYGGITTLRYGVINEFQSFLSLPGTWYLVDSSTEPKLDSARTIISASPKTLSDYKEVKKEVVWSYYLAPWNKHELDKCRSQISTFGKITSEFMDSLYDKIGGIPRYVLQKPSESLGLFPDELGRAEREAYGLIQRAIDQVTDATVYIQCFSKAEDSLAISSRILHRWPTDDHSDFEFRWASEHIQKAIYDKLDQQSWRKVLEMIVRAEGGEGLFFEYVAHILRKGGYTFEIKELAENATPGRLEIPKRPTVNVYQRAADFRELGKKEGTLYIPATPNFPCIDAALGADKLFQMTMSQDHPIKQTPFKEIIDAIREGFGGTLNLYFVVPEERFENFKRQSYLNNDGLVSKAVPQEVQAVKQFALKFCLQSAYRGGSPGM